ncbi:MAG: replicative DNA helicase [Acidobacteriia bacterium]|nr:replicative DNA helicase [Terriglobia bacterium]
MKELLPCNVEVERALLGAILLDNTYLYVAAERLSRDDFFSEANRLCWDAMKALIEKRVQADTVTVIAELERQGFLEKCGGAVRVCALPDGVPIGPGTPIPDYCHIIHEGSAKRKILNLSQKVVAEVADGVGSTEIIEAAESVMAEIRGEEEKASRGAMPISELVTECLPILDHMSGKGVRLGIPSGFADLDALTGGFVPSDMVILAGRPSEGKTALALEFLLRAAKAGHPVAMFSLEMSRTSLVLRLLCREARIDHHKLRTGFLSREEWGQLSNSLSTVRKLPIWVDDRADASASGLRWRIRSLAHRAAVKLVVVDYLQLVRAKAENRTQEVTKISLELKAAARDLGEICGGTLIAVSQLNRIAANERPRLHHLRESGQLEQDADVVLLISNAEPAENGQEKPNTKIIDVTKQRNGPCGDFPLTFLPRWVGFEDYIPEEVTLP